MTRKRILFVDDEPSLLEGLQNMLRRQRREWDMVFAAGGEAALQELAKAPFDVVVSDMRMPGMDGATLLREVQHEYPKAARIVLSGHAERDMVVRALPVAHQYLSKPCDPEVLRLAIDQTCQLQNLLHDDDIRSLVGRIDKLPSVPRCYLELTNALGQPEAGLEDVARIIEKEPAMAAKVLQLVNSAYFGTSQHITSVRRAVVYLGIELIQGLVLSVQVFEPLKATPLPAPLTLDRLQEHSLLTARLARRCMSDPQHADAAFAAGIVHDLGQILLALAFGPQYGAVLLAADEGDRSIEEVEQEAFGVTHAAAGAYLLGVWGLPFPIVEAVAHHHAPSRAPASELVAVLHGADALVEALARDEAVDPLALMEPGFVVQRRLEAELARWKTVAESELQKVVALS